MENELVTVIITTYKRSFDMLYRALNSVINQTYDNLEIIVIDDSPENFEGRKIIKEQISAMNDERIKYIQHEKNKGACAARNTGIKASNGRIIMFLDDDDEWTKEKVKKHYDIHIKKNAQFVYSGCKRIMQLKNGKTKADFVLKTHEDKVFFEKLLGENFVGSVSFVSITRKCIKECGYFNEELKSCQDWDMWIRVISKFKASFINEPLVIYYIHQSERITTNPKKQLQGHEFIMKSYEKLLNKYPLALRENLYRMSRLYADDKNYKKSIIFWKQANNVRPYSINDSIKAFLKIVVRYKIIS